MTDFDPIIKVPDDYARMMGYDSTSVRQSDLIDSELFWRECSEYGCSHDGACEHCEAALLLPWLRKAVKLADDIEIVIPEEVRAERDSRGFPWASEPTQPVAQLRVWRDDFAANRFLAKQSDYPLWWSFLHTFETDPETVVEVPEEVQRFFGYDLRHVRVADLDDLRWIAREMRDDACSYDSACEHCGAILVLQWLDTFETTPAAEVPRKQQRPASWAFCPFCKEPIAESGPNIQYLSGNGGPMHSSCEEFSTRLERVAAGVERDPYVGGKQDGRELREGMAAHAPEFRLRPYREPLTIIPDPADGDDVAADATSDRYFGVKR